MWQIEGMSTPLVSDALWSLIAPFLPPEQPKPRGGRPRSITDRAALSGILFRCTGYAGMIKAVIEASRQAHPGTARPAKAAS